MVLLSSAPHSGNGDLRDGAFRLSVRLSVDDTDAQFAFARWRYGNVLLRTGTYRLELSGWYTCWLLVGVDAGDGEAGDDADTLFIYSTASLAAVVLVVVAVCLLLLVLLLKKRRARTSWFSRKFHSVFCSISRRSTCGGPSVSYYHCNVYKKAQLSLTNPRDAKACQKLLQFDVLTTSLTILAYLHSFSCCCVRNLRNPANLTKNSNLWSSRSSKVIDLGVNGKTIYDFLLVINSNFGRICYRFRDIDA